jgi:plastocyanin
VKKLTPNLAVYGAAALVAAALLALPPDTQPVVAPTPAPAEALPQVTIASFAFSAASVQPAAAVTVTNLDGTDHTVTSGDGSFDVTAARGATSSFVAPAAPGTYAFFCAIHPSMTGTLTVA